MEKRHPVIRAVSLALPSALLIGGCVLYALSVSQAVPNGEFRAMPSPAALASPRNRIALTHLTSLRLPGSALRLNGAGTALYAGMTTEGLAAIDTTDPARASIVSHLRHVPPEPPAGKNEVVEYVLNAYLVDGRLVVLDRVRGLVVHDASDPLRPEFLWAKKLPGSPAEQAIDLEHAGQSIFLASGGAGLVQLEADFGPDSTPKYLLTRFDHTTDATFLPPRWILATDGRNTGLQILEISDLSQTRPVGNLSSWPLYFESAVIIGDHAFVTTRGDNVILAFNLTDPGRPHVSSIHRRPISAIKSVATWRERYVIVGNHFGFIEVVDAADPEHPALVAMLPIPGIVGSLYVQGDVLFAGIAGQKRLDIFRLTERENLEPPPGSPPSEA